LVVVGGDDLRFETVFEENKKIFDREAESLANLTFRNTEIRSRTIKGRYSGTYKWGRWITLTPSYAYTLVEAEGNIAIPNVAIGRAYYDLGPDRRSDGYIPQTRAINPSLQMQFIDLGVLRAPKVGYNFTQTRDYVRNELRTPGRLDFTTTLDMASAGEGWKAIPAVDFSQTFDVDSTVNNDVRIRNDARSDKLRQWMQDSGEFGSRYDSTGNNLQLVPSIALSEQQQGLESLWWVRLGENVLDPLNVENIAVSARRASATSFTTRFDLTLLPNWTGSFTPRWNLGDERVMGAPDQVTRNIRSGIGTGLDFRDPHILFWQSLKPSNLTFNYSYNTSDSFQEYVTYVEVEDKTRSTESHDFGVTLPTRPTEKTALTFAYRQSNSTEKNLNRGIETSTSTSSTQSPALKLVYLLQVDKPVKLWDVWPFNGRELRIRQNFRLDNDLWADYVRRAQKGNNATQSESGSDTYGLRNQLSYNVLDNVKLNFILEQKLYNDASSQKALNTSGDYYSIKFELGLEATF
jgi:hypothetical protein